MAEGDFCIHAFRRAMVDQGLWAKLSGQEAKVIYCLERHVNRNGRAWPSRELLEHETGMSERHCRRARARLMKRGILLIERLGGGVGKTTCVMLVMPGETPAAAPETGAPEVRERGRRISANRGAGCPQTGAPFVREPGRHAPPELPRTTQEHHKNRPALAGRGDGDGFSICKTMDAETEKFLRETCKLNLHARLAGAAEGLTLGVAKRLWRNVVNSHPQGLRQGPMAQAVMDGLWRREPAAEAEAGMGLGEAGGTPALRCGAGEVVR